MNIVIITNILPYPLNSGGAQAQYNFIDCLRKRHKISIIFTEEGRNKLSNMKILMNLWPEVDFYPYKYIRQLCYPRFIIDKAERAFGLAITPNSRHFKVMRALKPYGVYFSKDFVTFVNKILHDTKADIMQAEFYPSLPIARYVPNTVKKIFIHHEIRFVRNERLLKDFKLNNQEKHLQNEIKKNEISNLNLYDTIVTLTNKDKDTLIKHGVKTNIKVSPAAINTKILPYKEWNGKITFIGGYGHIPNKEGINWFIEKVIPLMNKKAPININIIGAGWPARYSETPGVNLLGFVDDLAKYAHGSILIVPILTGSGMRMKILEAAAMSIPFITTTIGVEGLIFRNGKECIVADTPEQFAKGLETMMNNSKIRKALAENANATYIELYSKENLCLIRENVYTS